MGSPDQLSKRVRTSSKTKTNAWERVGVTSASETEAVAELSGKFLEFLKGFGNRHGASFDDEDFWTKLMAGEYGFLLVPIRVQKALRDGTPIPSSFR